jgi:hypothetical protein
MCDGPSLLIFVLVIVLLGLFTYVSNGQAKLNLLNARLANNANALAEISAATSEMLKFRETMLNELAQQEDKLDVKQANAHRHYLDLDRALFEKQLQSLPVSNIQNNNPLLKTAKTESQDLNTTTQPWIIEATQQEFQHARQVDDQGYTQRLMQSYRLDGLRQSRDEYPDNEFEITRSNPVLGRYRDLRPYSQR